MRANDAQCRSLAVFARKDIVPNGCNPLGRLFSFSRINSQRKRTQNEEKKNSLEFIKCSFRFISLTRYSDSIAASAWRSCFSMHVLPLLFLAWKDTHTEIISISSNGKNYVLLTPSLIITPRLPVYSASIYIYLKTLYPSVHINGLLAGCLVFVLIFFASRSCIMNNVKQ